MDNDGLTALKSRTNRLSQRLQLQAGWPLIWHSLYLNRIFRTFGANKKQKFPATNNLHGLSNHAVTLFPKSTQVVD
jgi:hypothetical protein